MTGKQELQAVIQGNGHFAKELYSILSQKPGNVIFSPISAHAVLSMAYQGAQGSTYDAFSKSLGVSTASLAAKGYKDVLGHFNKYDPSEIQLLMANRIYIMKGHSLQAAVREVIEKNFESKVEAVNFAESKQSAKNINAWVESKTQGKIKDLISPDSLDDLTRLVLVNTLYFKGTWAHKFEKFSTRLDKFYLNDNDSIDVQMMYELNAYYYEEDECLGARVLEIPYLDPEVSLVVILPNKRNGIAELEQKLAGIDLTKSTRQTNKTDLIVKLPKFKIETTIDLNQSLQKMGLGVIFDQNKANFYGMLVDPEPWPLYVDQVVQKVFIDVNEDGTEAAAATRSSLRGGGNTDSFPKFIADHPFVVILKSCRAVEDNEKQETIYFNNILFQGRVSNPTI